MTAVIAARRQEAQRIIEALAKRWRMQFEIEDILGDLAEIRSYERIEEYYRLGLISDETAKRCVRLLDEAL